MTHCHILLKQRKYDTMSYGSRLEERTLPKQTFFNLSQQKIHTLIEAAEKEFARVPLFEASIANIIKTAGIPRGSFYQYFEDKEDLYSYLLEEKLKKTKVYFLALLRRHNGDMIEAMKEMYHYFLTILPNEEERNFLRNALLYTTNKVENSFTNMFDVTRDHTIFKEITELIDTSRFNINDHHELVHVFKIITAIAFHNFVEKTLKGLTDEEAIQAFSTSMDLIKRGIYRQ